MLKKMVSPTPGFSEAPMIAIDSGEKKNFEALVKDIAQLYIILNLIKINFK